MGCALPYCGRVYDAALSHRARLSDHYRPYAHITYQGDDYRLGRGGLNSLLFSVKIKPLLVAALFISPTSWQHLPAMAGTATSQRPGRYEKTPRFRVCPKYKWLGKQRLCRDHVWPCQRCSLACCYSGKTAMPLQKLFLRWLPRLFMIIPSGAIANARCLSAARKL